MPLQPVNSDVMCHRMSKNDKKIEAFFDKGAEIAGPATGGAVGFLVGGPFGASIGGALGPIIGFVAQMPIRD